ncbi:hypothetical protein MCHI_001505, partial [Candidatus Magnetoovum chiemensis]
MYYNTQKMSYEELRDTFIGRRALLDSIKDELTLPDNETPKQHWILFGPRGIGKT